MNESSPKPPSIEELKKKYKVELESILYAELTPENIENFADVALDKLVKLVAEISSGNRTTREQEDILFRQFELANIPEIMNRIVVKKQQIDSLKEYIVSTASREYIDRVITPPGETGVRIEPASGAGVEKKKQVPRLLTLMYILENDFQIPKEEVKITEGIVSRNMMRQTPYVRVQIPGLNRLVYVCDEEENASYIFDTEKMKEIPDLTVEDIDLETKMDRDEMIEKCPGIGARVIQSKNWRGVISKYLESELIEQIESTKKPRSEFEKKIFLAFDQFQIEVMTKYGELPEPKPGNIQKWYYRERPLHEHWPGGPVLFYKDKGWVGWPELVGIENSTKIEYINFEDFQKEVRNSYKEGQSYIRSWYRKERPSHKNWPSAPDVTYKDRWSGWPELVGKENRLKRIGSILMILKMRC